MSKFLNVDVDNTLGGVNTSHEKVASQRAVKEYIDGNVKPVLDIVFSGGNGEEVEDYQSQEGILYVSRVFDSCSVSLEVLHEAINGGSTIRVTEDGANAYHRQVNNELVLASHVDYQDEPEYKRIDIELRTVPQVGKNEDSNEDTYYYLSYESSSGYEETYMYRESDLYNVSRAGRTGNYQHLNNRPNFESTVSVLDELQFSGSIQSPWRTMTREEWEYLLFNRTTSIGVEGYDDSNPRFAKALVGDDATQGLIIFPDTGGSTGGIYTTVANVNESAAEFSDNRFSASDWNTHFKPVGCVFLPVAGVRDGTNIDSSVGVYHTSTNDDSNRSYELLLTDNNVYVRSSTKSRGKAVRLVHDSLVGKFSVGLNQNSDPGAIRKVNIATSNLQYHCRNKQWRFATNPWDFIGNDNTNIAQNYNGWIDLFGYGTSGWNSGYNAYQPWSTSTNGSDYIRRDLVNEWKNADWGIFNFGRSLEDSRLHIVDITLDETQNPMTVSYASATPAEVRAIANSGVFVVARITWVDIKDTYKLYANWTGYPDGFTFCTPYSSRRIYSVKQQTNSTWAVYSWTVNAHMVRATNPELQPTGSVATWVCNHNMNSSQIIAAVECFNVSKAWCQSEGLENGEVINCRLIRSGSNALVIKINTESTIQPGALAVNICASY